MEPESEEAQLRLPRDQFSTEFWKIGVAIVAVSVALASLVLTPAGD